jgi:antitoxin CptB
MNEAMDERRKRARFRAWRRGFREIDLILGGFADARIAALDDAALADFEALLEAPDQDVYAWITNAAPTPAAFDTPTMTHLKAFRLAAQPS